MAYLLQWPVLTFTGMALAFGVTLLALSVLDQRHT